MKIDERKIHRYLVFAIILVHIIGLFVDIMDFDASRSAAIAQEMLKEGHWLQIQNGHKAYLNSSPLLFWFSAISFKLFGFSNFAFRLPAFLFALLTMYSTYQLTKKYYGRRAGRIASIIIGSVQGIFAITMDVRPDTLLIGAVIFSIWQLTEYLKNKNFSHLILGSMGIACAMLTKGPIGLLVPVLAIGTDSILHKRWKELFKWQWLIVLGIVALLLTPMLYGLYEQFDKHQEQLIGGKTGVSGLTFYFWEQYFTHLPNSVKPIQYVNTLLWAFLPWTIVLLAAMAERLQHFRKETKYPEYLSIGGLLLPLLVLLLFPQRLPPYLFVVFPLAAMLTGAYLDKLQEKAYKILKNTQLVLLFLLWILAFILLFYIFTPTNIVIAVISIAIFALMIWGLFKLPQFQILVIGTTLTAIGFNLVLSGHAYPHLLKYQSSTKVGRRLKSQPKEREHFAYFRTRIPAIDFYAGQIFPVRDAVTKLSQNDRFLFTDEAGLLALKKGGISYLLVQTYEDYPVTKLSLPFLNPKQRPNLIGHKYLVAIYPTE